MTFCRTWDTEDHGQIVAIKQHDDRHPSPWQLAILCQPQGAISHCQVILSFSSEENRDKLFRQLGINTLLRITAGIFNSFPNGEFDQDAYDKAYPGLVESAS